VVENGLSRDAIIQLIAHLAFSPGWPTAISAVPVAKEGIKPRL
jgi:4-carboxymuconolactone decarboxylase